MQPQSKIPRASTLIVIIVLALLALPAIATIQVMWTMWSVNSSISSVHSRIGRSLLSNGIETGKDRTALRQLEKKLKAMAAPAHDAPLHTRRLHVIAIENAPDADLTNQRAVEIDITKAGQWSALMMVEAPTHFDIIGSTDKQRAKIAVEGRLPFSFAASHDGILGGFRIRAFGARSTTGIRDLQRADQRKYRRRFCRALRRWLQHYDLQARDVVVWQLVGAKKIRIWQGQVLPDNQKINRVGNGKRICPRY